MVLRVESQRRGGKGNEGDRPEAHSASIEVLGGEGSRGSGRGGTKKKSFKNRYQGKGQRGEIRVDKWPAWINKNVVGSSCAGQQER